MSYIRTTMKSICILLGLLLVSAAVFSQTLDWKDFPDKTVVFKLNDKEALKLLKGKFHKKNWDKVLQAPFASFSKEWEERPEKGHFIFADIKRNKVNYRYYPIIPFQVFLFKEYGALTLQVVDGEGNIRKDAKVRMDHSSVLYDPNSQTYSCKDYSETEKHILTVKLDDFRAVFDLTKHLVPSWYDNGGYGGDSPSFYSYLITDKNKYKPGETVRFKSYALSTYKRPIKKELTLYICTKDFDLKKIMDVSPYHPGGFSGEFQLHDSLELQLDRVYSIQLWDHRGRIVSSTSFRYEDYELYGKKLKVELEAPVQYFPQVNRLRIEATDANGLPLQEMDAEVHILRKNVLNSYTNVLVLPDTLMTRRLTFDTSGRAIVEVSSDLFGLSDCIYEAVVVARTSDNERMEQHCSGAFYYLCYDLNCNTKNDSLSLSFFDRGKERVVDAELTVDGDKNSKKVRLPHLLKFNQSAKGYHLRIPSCDYEKYISTDQLPNQLELKGEINTDSLKVSLINPLQLEVSWYVYQGNMLLEKGAGKELDLRVGEIDYQSTYYVEVFCFMGSREQVVRKAFRFQANQLTIESDLPERIYPGQKVETTLSIHDAHGRPVSGVDLTAFSVNSQLGYVVPDLPYYGSEAQGREQRASYSMERKEYLYSTSLDYTYWNHRLHLDSLPYYQFIYPLDTLFKYAMDTPDGITQFAPYVMKEGSSVGIYVIELNDVPCYFSWTEQPQGYSFKVPYPASKQKMTLRLSDRAIVIDSICFEKGKKTILSLDMEHLPDEAKVVWLKTPVDRRNRNVFGTQEKKRYANYISRLPVPENAEYTCLEGDHRMHPVYLRYSFRSNKKNILAGPIDPGHLKYVNGVTYRHEGGFAYEFEGNVVYKYSEDVCPSYLEYSSTSQITNLNDFYFTPEVFRKFMDKCRQMNAWHPQSIHIAQFGKTMNFRLPVEKDSTGVANFLFEDRMTGDVFCPNPTVDNWQKADEYPDGIYNVIVLYNNGKYLKQDSIPVFSGCYLDVNMGASEVHVRDSLSTVWLDLQRSFGWAKATPSYRELRLASGKWGSGNQVCGYVYDEDDGEPLIGVSVIVKGTLIGTITDVDGYFELMCERGENVIQFCYIGMQTKEVTVSSNAELTVMLKADYQALGEVVVVAYGIERRTSLAGSLAGVQITGDKPEMIVPTEEFPEEQEEAKEAERKLYNELMQLNSLRKNFADVGFWKPELLTGKDGTVRFGITFPDNITQWDAFVYAMNRKLQTGTYRRQIKSYKPLMAELSTPRFLTVGDKADLVGTIRNYTADKTIKGTTSFSLGSDTLIREAVEFNGVHTTKLPVEALTEDSIVARYIFTRTDGYEDGEERSLSVVPQGTESRTGTLHILRMNEAVKVEAGVEEEIRIDVSGNQLDTYMDAIHYLGGYRYLCNEQLASKLIGLLGDRKITAYRGQKFTKDREITKIIRRLLDNQNDEGLWSWWGRSKNTSLWMSAHILNALKMASEDGYEVKLTLPKSKAGYALKHSYNGIHLEDIRILHALYRWGVEQDYAAVSRLLYPLIRRHEEREDSLQRVDKHYIPRSYLEEKLLLWEMQQSTMNVTDSLRPYLKKDALGGVYCADGRSVSGNSLLANTLIAYRIIRNDSSLDNLKEPMQLRILYTRNGGWNTYQASQAISTVLGDLLDESSPRNISSIVELEGKENGQLTEFPYTVRLKAGEKLTFTRKGGMPVILSAYSVKRVSEANAGEVFEIYSAFKDGDKLTVGEPAVLTVTLNVKQAGAEHVMLEVPIPASCSYASKTSPGFPEVHREYFKEKTVIFCEKLPMGKYAFHLSLLPRYTGTYSLNPAKVELMYFPVVTANNNMRNIQVIDKKIE